MKRYREHMEKASETLVFMVVLAPFRPPLAARGRSHSALDGLHLRARPRMVRHYAAARAFGGC